MPDERRSTYLLCGRIHFRHPGAGDDAAIGALARCQGGVVERRQLAELGVSRRAIEHRLKTGRLRSIHPRVYAVGHDAVSYAARAQAAVMSVRGARVPATASHWTAAGLLELCDPCLPIHVSCAQDRRPRRGVVVHRTRVRDDERSVVDGVPITTPAKTLLDLSGIAYPSRLHRLVKQAEFSGLIDGAALREMLDRYPRRRGRRNLAAIVRVFMSDHRLTRSELEDRFCAFCITRGIRLPDTNYPLEVEGERFEVDCFWPGARLIVELDGRDGHERALAFEEDRRRDRRLIAAGWVPMRITSAAVCGAGDRLERELRTALGQLSDARRSDHTGGV